MTTQPQSSANEQAKALVKNINELTELLRHQREQMKQQGMTLPTGSLDNLRTLKARADSLQRQLGNTLIQLNQLRALADTTALINSTLDTESVLNQVMDTVINLTGAERGYIVLINRLTGALDDFKVMRGLDAAQVVGAGGGDEASSKNSTIISTTIVNEVARTGQPILTDNASTDERYRGQQSIVSFALRSILAVPLKVRDEVIGVVYCDNRVMAGLFQPSDRDILAAFANQAGVAIENARLFEQTSAQLDQLTQIRDFLQRVFDSIISGIITVSSKGTITTINSAARSILHLDYDPIGLSLLEVLPEMGENFKPLLRKVRDTGEPQMLEAYPIMPQLPAQPVWNVIISALRDAESGASQGIALGLDDLTAQKQGEARVKELRRYLPHALLKNIRSVEDVNTSGQERVITAIATDVRGFTTFSERLQPEQLMETINRYLSVASDAINLYEGIVDKYMGDAVTGLFNTQLNAQEDHAVRAVRAAMSIIYDLYALHEVVPEDQRLYYGIGIHTGPAFLGNIGSSDRQEFTALGEATDISKILEGNAQKGEIIISEATYQLVQEYFECEPRQPDPEKTKGRPISVIYRVVKRKKTKNTSSLVIDPELAELLKGLNQE